MAATSPPAATIAAASAKGNRAAARPARSSRTRTDGRRIAPPDRSRGGYMGDSSAVGP